MKLPRDLSGDDLAKALCRNFAYRRVAQVGSHLTLETTEPTRQRVVVPLHKALRIGTLNGILRSVAEHKKVSREDILRTL